MVSTVPLGSHSEVFSLSWQPSVFASHTTAAQAAPAPSTRQPRVSPQGSLVSAEPSLVQVRTASASPLQRVDSATQTVAGGTQAASSQLWLSGQSSPVSHPRRQTLSRQSSPTPQSLSVAQDRGLVSSVFIVSAASGLVAPSVLSPQPADAIVTPKAIAAIHAPRQ